MSLTERVSKSFTNGLGFFGATAVTSSFALVTGAAILETADPKNRDLLGITLVGTLGAATLNGTAGLIIGAAFKGFDFEGFCKNLLKLGKNNFAQQVEYMGNVIYLFLIGQILGSNISCAINKANSISHQEIAYGDIIFSELIGFGLMIGILIAGLSTYYCCTPNSCSPEPEDNQVAMNAV